MDKQNKLRILISILFVGFLIMLVINIMPEKKVEANKVLNQSSSLALMKYLRYDMSSVENNELISDEIMLKVALSYMRINENYENKITYDDENYIATVSLTNINEVVKYVFDKTVDYTNVSYNVFDGKVQIPIVPTSGDAQIYKYNSTEFNKQENVYYAYIDCLEAHSSEEQSKLQDENTTDYKQSEVISTIRIKYKVVDGRKVLLSYTTN